MRLHCAPWYTALHIPHLWQPHATQTCQQWQTNKGCSPMCADSTATYSPQIAMQHSRRQQIGRTRPCWHVCHRPCMMAALTSRANASAYRRTKMAAHSPTLSVCSPLHSWHPARHKLCCQLLDVHDCWCHDSGQWIVGAEDILSRPCACAGL